MDPVTQGALGAAVSLALLPRLRPVKNAPFSYSRIALLGALGAMAPDLDVLIRSPTDGLVAIEYHRHFTHSLAFIPIGGVLAALPWLAFKKWRREKAAVISASILGYATHAVLDACTTYGTLLFWPFSDTRVSLSYISVVDLVYTLPLLAGVFATLTRKRAIWVWAGLAWGQAYICLGALQHARAMNALTLIATQRTHTVERAGVFPSIGTNITWRAVYEHQNRFYVDKIRVPYLGAACVSPGTSVAVPPPLTPGHPRALRGLSLLRWFSDDWAAFDPEEPSILSDLRYSFSPQEISPIWGVRFSQQGTPVATPTAVNHATEAEWVNHRSRRGLALSDLTRLWFENSADAKCF